MSQSCQSAVRQPPYGRPHPAKSPSAAMPPITQLSLDQLLLAIRKLRPLRMSLLLENLTLDEEIAEVIRAGCITHGPTLADIGGNGSPTKKRKGPSRSKSAAATPTAAEAVNRLADYEPSFGSLCLKAATYLEFTTGHSSLFPLVLRDEGRRKKQSVRDSPSDIDGNALRPDFVITGAAKSVKGRVIPREDHELFTDSHFHLLVDGIKGNYPTLANRMVELHRRICWPSFNSKLDDDGTASRGTREWLTDLQEQLGGILTQVLGADGLDWVAETLVPRLRKQSAAGSVVDSFHPTTQQMGVSPWDAAFIISKTDKAKATKMTKQWRLNSRGRGASKLTGLMGKNPTNRKRFLYPLDIVMAYVQEQEPKISEQNLDFLREALKKRLQKPLPMVGWDRSEDDDDDD